MEDTSRQWAVSEFLSFCSSSTFSSKATSTALARDVSCIFTFGSGGASVDLVSAALEAPAERTDARVDLGHAQIRSAVAPAFDADDAQSSTIVGTMLVGAIARALVVVDGDSGSDSAASEALIGALKGVLTASRTQKIAASRALDFLCVISRAACALRDNGASADGAVRAFTRTLSSHEVIDCIVNGGDGDAPNFSHSLTVLVDLVHFLCAVCACATLGGAVWTALADVGARAILTFKLGGTGGAPAVSHAAAALAGAFSDPSPAERHAAVDVAIAALKLGAEGVAMTRGAAQGAATALIRCSARSEELRCALSEALAELTCAAPDVIGAAAIDAVLIPTPLAASTRDAGGPIGAFHAAVFGCAGAVWSAAALLRAFAPFAGTRARTAVKLLNLRSRAAAYAGAAADVLCAIAGAPAGTATLANDIIFAAATLGAAAASTARALPPFFIKDGEEMTGVAVGDAASGGGSGGGGDIGGGGGGSDPLVSALARLAREPLALVLRHAAASGQGVDTTPAVALAAGLMSARALSPAIWPAISPLLPAAQSTTAASAAGVAWATAAALVSAAQDPRAPPKLAADRDALMVSANSTRASFLLFFGDSQAVPIALAQAALRLGAGTSAVPTPVPHSYSAASGGHRSNARAVAAEEVRNTLALLRPAQPLADSVFAAATVALLQFAGAPADCGS